MNCNYITRTEKIVACQEGLSGQKLEGRKEAGDLRQKPLAKNEGKI
jgi:hypothetical protein